jgi:hypothetical protein
VLDPDGRDWNEVATLAIPRFFHRLLPMTDRKLLAVGGSNHQGQIKEMETVSLGVPSSPAPAPAKDHAKD